MKALIIDDVKNAHLADLAIGVRSDEEAEEILKAIKAASVEPYSEEDVRSNLAYHAGRYDDDTRVRVEKHFKSEHPIFGKYTEMGRPSNDEAFLCGNKGLTLKQVRALSKSQRKMPEGISDGLDIIGVKSNTIKIIGESYKPKGNVSNKKQRRTKHKGI